MKVKTRVYVTFAILVLLVAGIYVFSDWFSKTTGYLLGEDQKVRFVSCLNEKNTILYTKDDCVECFRQQGILGDKAFEIIEKFNCAGNSCANLRELPAWEINGKIYYGKKDFKELSEISGCEI